MFINNKNTNIGILLAQQYKVNLIFEIQFLIF